jgi:hypothetical protein
MQNKRERSLQRKKTQELVSSTQTNAAVLTRIYNEQQLKEIPALT